MQGLQHGGTVDRTMTADPVETPFRASMPAAALDSDDGLRLERPDDGRASVSSETRRDQRSSSPPWVEDRAGDRRAMTPMAGDQDAPEAVESVAAIAGHPLHPSVVPLPIGAFVGAFVADLAYARSGDPFWARAARHLTDAGIVTGLVAGSLGAMDFTGREPIRRHGSAWVHGLGNATVLGMAVLSRSMRQRDERRAGERGAMWISGLSVALLGVTGWLGGELSYRHRIGVIPHDR
jgi:uncharacterized membrane protein